tara:strand:+ start:244 stop:471 length:228 start_codon:yes stop_codon:yes gene_type:complete
MNEELMEYYSTKGLEGVKRDIKKHKQIIKSPVTMNLLCRVELCIQALEYEKRNLNYMVTKYMDYHLNKIKTNKQI